MTKTGEMKVIMLHVRSISFRSHMPAIMLLVALGLTLVSPLALHAGNNKKKQATATEQKHHREEAANRYQQACLASAA